MQVSLCVSRFDVRRIHELSSLFDERACLQVNKGAVLRAYKYDDFRSIF